MRNALIMLAFLPAIALSADPAAEIKGIRLGATEAEVVAALPSPDTRCINLNVPGQRTCYSERQTYANAAAKIYASMTNGLVHSVRVTVSPKLFESVVEAIKTKYGAPVFTSTEKLQTVGGAVLDGRELIWKVSGVTLYAREYGGRIDESWIMLRNDPNDDPERRRQEQLKTQRAKDL